MIHRRKGATLASSWPDLGTHGNVVLPPFVCTSPWRLSRRVGKIGIAGMCRVAAVSESLQRVAAGLSPMCSGPSCGTSVVDQCIDASVEVPGTEPTSLQCRRRGVGEASSTAS